MRVIRLLICAGIGCVLSGAPAWSAPMKIVFQFDAPLSSDQAPYYLALSKGWFASAGIEAKLVEGTDQESTIAAVRAGKADIGVADAATILAFKAQGAALKIVAAVSDKSPRCLYFLAANALGEPKKLANKKVAVDPFDAGRVVFPLLARENDIRIQDVSFSLMGPSERVGALASGSVDAVFGTLDQNRALSDAVGPGALGHLLWADFGFDLYGACLFVREDAVKAKRQTLRAFLDAAFKAWELSLRDPGQAVAALGIYRVVEPGLSTRFIDELSDMKTLFDTPAYRTKGIGYMDSVRMAAVADAVVEVWGVPIEYKIADAMTLELLPTPAVRMPQEKPAPKVKPPAAGTPGAEGSASGAKGAAQ